MLLSFLSLTQRKPQHSNELLINEKQQWKLTFVHRNRTQLKILPLSGNPHLLDDLYIFREEGSPGFAVVRVPRRRKRRGRREFWRIVFLVRELFPRLLRSKTSQVINMYQTTACKHTSKGGKLNLPAAIRPP